MVDRLSHLAGLISGLAIVVLNLIVVYEVVMRDLGSPTKWVFDTSIYLTIWLVYLGGTFASYKKSHVIMDALAVRIPEKWQQLRQFVVNIFIIVFLLLLTWLGWGQTVASYNRNMTTVGTIELPLYLLHLAIPVGGMLMLLQHLQHMVLLRKRKGRI